MTARALPTRERGRFFLCGVAAQHVRFMPGHGTPFQGGAVVGWLRVFGVGQADVDQACGFAGVGTGGNRRTGDAGDAQAQSRAGALTNAVVIPITYNFWKGKKA